MLVSVSLMDLTVQETLDFGSLDQYKGQLVRD